MVIKKYYTTVIVLITFSFIYNMAWGKNPSVHKVCEQMNKNISFKSDISGIADLYVGIDHIYIYLAPCSDINIKLVVPEKMGYSKGYMDASKYAIYHGGYVTIKYSGKIFSKSFEHHKEKYYLIIKNINKINQN